MVKVDTPEKLGGGSVDVTLIEEGVRLDEEVGLDRDVCEYTLILQPAPHTTAALPKHASEQSASAVLTAQLERVESQRHHAAASTPNTE